MKNKMKPLPVRFDSSVMDRCKDIFGDTPFICKSASDVARSAMELGLSQMEEVTKQHCDTEQGGSHLQSDLLK